MIPGAQHKIDVVVSGWPGVTSGPHRFGGTEWRLGKREIGHIHGDEMVDIPFPKHLRDELIAAHQVEAHHVRPDSGWVTLPLGDDEDLKWAVVLLRHSYELARQRVAQRTGRPVPRPSTDSTAARTLAEVA
jgi:hypothetical protein